MPTQPLTIPDPQAVEDATRRAKSICSLLIADSCNGFANGRQFSLADHVLVDAIDAIQAYLEQIEELVNPGACQ